ncbi:hypothetical protein P5673_020864 [Acropora cervicornis]|uniref:Uncharacterized protein n=1 Tax=Acropora cervicornis TaxID=6130 RepID=A0AAD9Q978_ACRCE|nr:hypothetical protein P5673_020864 [Acropora cervicornis]
MAKIKALWTDTSLGCLFCDMTSISSVTVHILHIDVATCRISVIPLSSKEAKLSTSHCSFSVIPSIRVVTNSSPLSVLLYLQATVAMRGAIYKPNPRIVESAWVGVIAKNCFVTRKCTKRCSI